jgi:deazaflavin-dependent oxidoreductase (nitroreductase family)
MLTAATRPRLGRIVGAAGDRRGPKRYCSLDKRRLDGPECDDRAIGERCRRVGHRYRLATVEGLPCGGIATAAAATLRSESNRRPTTTKRRPITVPRSANKNPRSRSDASAHRSQAPGPSGTQGLIQTLQTSVVNSLIRLAFRIGVPDPGDALLETTGRRTGKPRLTPVCDGLEGGAFWLLAQRGRDADWVRNIEADPLVRVKLRSRRPTTWRSGTAHILDDDDPHERQRILGRGKPWRRLCLSTSGALATDLLTVRIDLDPEVSSRCDASRPSSPRSNASRLSSWRSTTLTDRRECGWAPGSPRGSISATAVFSQAPRPSGSRHSNGAFRRLARSRTGFVVDLADAQDHSEALTAIRTRVNAERFVPRFRVASP